MGKLDALLRRADAAEELLRRRAARRRMADFARYMDPPVPEGKYRVDALHERICDMLDRVLAGGIERAMIFVPPQHGKSTIVSRLFPCFALGHNPTWQIIQTGHGNSLTLAHSRGARDLFVGDAMHRLFPDVHHAPEREGQRSIAPPRQAAHEWGTTQGGKYYAASFESSIVGRGCQLMLIDDPHKGREDADSPTQRDKAWSIYMGDLLPRLSPGGRIVLVATRWHPDDLPGRILRHEAEQGVKSWHVLSMPAIDADGNALWPEVRGREFLDAIQRSVSPREWNAQYQQRPTVEGGAIFRQEWWPDSMRFDIDDRAISSRCVGRVIAWDCANKEGRDNDYTAWAVGELSPEYLCYVREVNRERLEFPRLCELVERVARQHNGDEKLQALAIEDAAAGTQLIQVLRTQGPRWLRDLVHPVSPGKGKVLEAQAVSTWCYNGCVYLPRPSESAPWLQPFENELYSFPASAHDDQVDAFRILLWYWHYYLAMGLEGVERPERPQMTAEQQALARLGQRQDNSGWY